MKTRLRTEREDPAFPVLREGGSPYAPLFGSALLVKSVMRGPPPICECDVSIREVGQQMAGHRAALIRTRNGYGIVTDSDLRRRVLAAGVSAERPIADVMTFPVRVVDPDKPAEELVLEMLEAGIHHLPVVEEGEVIGMVSDLDVLNIQHRTPFALRDRIGSASTIPDLVDAGKSLPNVAADLWRAGLDGAHIGQWLSVLTDQITARLLDASVERLGPAPVEWAWLALGSLGRREQALTADQDHALVYDAGGEAHDAYFGALADEVVSALAACGFPKCESRVMASEPAWRMALPAWLDRLEQWMAEPDRRYSFLSGIIFDYRQIAGTLTVVPELNRMTGKAANNTRFLRRLAELAVAHPSPLGMVGRLKTRKDTRGKRVLDVKEHGLFPITEMARALALSAGVAVPSTLERLGRVADHPEWSDSGTSLAQVYRLMQQVRFQHQMRQLEEGVHADDFVLVDNLDRLTRLELRDAFRVLRSTMNQLAYQLNVVL